MANGIRKRDLVKDIAKTEVLYSAAEVEAAFKNGAGKHLTFVPLDTKYWAQTPAVWKRILQYSSIDTKEYKAERYDCDDFAFAFKGSIGARLSVNSIGMVVDYSGGHAYNAILVAYPPNPDSAAMADGADPLKSDLRVVFIEPQNDSVVAKGQEMSDQEIYKMTQGFVIS